MDNTYTIARKEHVEMLNKNGDIPFVKKAPKFTEVFRSGGANRTQPCEVEVTGQGTNDKIQVTTEGQVLKDFHYWFSVVIQYAGEDSSLAHFYENLEYIGGEEMKEAISYYAEGLIKRASNGIPTGVYLSTRRSPLYVTTLILYEALMKTKGDKKMRSLLLENTSFSFGTINPVVAKKVLSHPYGMFYMYDDFRVSGTLGSSYHNSGIGQISKYQSEEEAEKRLQINYIATSGVKCDYNSCAYYRFTHTTGTGSYLYMAATGFPSAIDYSGFLPVSYMMEELNLDKIIKPPLLMNGIIKPYEIRVAKGFRQRELNGMYFLVNTMFGRHVKDE